MESKRKKIVVVAGPTGVGKTEVAIRLAEYYGAEIISADSRQLYKELTVGTARPSEAELARVKHYFIGSHSIHESYDAARYSEEAMAYIHELFTRMEYVIVCGGSGLYIRALFDGLDEIPPVPDEIRNEVNQQYEQRGIAWLQQELKKRDPVRFETIDQRNPARMMRALEVVLATGQSITSFQSRKPRNIPYTVIKLGLERNRDDLYNRIEARMDQMLAEGLLEEAKSLYEFRHHNALQTVGYQEVFDFIDGMYDYAEMVRLLKRNSRRYAKRQMTWFRSDEEFHWIHPSQFANMIEIIDSAD